MYWTFSTYLSTYFLNIDLKYFKNHGFRILQQCLIACQKVISKYFENITKHSDNYLKIFVKYKHLSYNVL